MTASDVPLAVDLRQGSASVILGVLTLGLDERAGVHVRRHSPPAVHRAAHQPLRTKITEPNNRAPSDEMNRCPIGTSQDPIDENAVQVSAPSRESISKLRQPARITRNARPESARPRDERVTSRR